MNNVFTKDFTVTINMLDKHNHLKMNSILDLAQEVASDHATQLGMGFKTFGTKNLYWVVVRTKVEVLENIDTPDVVTLVTFPTSIRMFEHPRDILFYYQGKLFAKCRMIWMILNTETKTVDSSVDLGNYASDHEPAFNERIKRIKIIDKDKLEFVKKANVSYSLIDRNSHLNNTRFFDFVYDTYEDIDYSKVQCEYLKQAFLHTDIYVYKYEDEEARYSYIYDDNDVLFACRIEK